MASTEFTQNRDNYCYRHPDRQSFVLCQRCLRTICPECQTQAAVGVICPECMAEQRGAQTAVQRKAERRWGRSRGAVTAVGDSRPLTTYWLIGITAVVFLTQLIPGSPVSEWFRFAGAYLIPAYGSFEPWRVFTVLLVHDGFIHIAFNMLALWMIGRSLEPLIGHWRFLTLYLVSGLGGSVAFALFANPLQAAVGASGAIFGLFGALLIIGRHLGANVGGIAIVIGINLVIGFLPGFQVAWQAHVGGLVAGAILGLIYARTRARRQRRLQISLTAILVVVLIALLAIPAFIYA